MRVRHVILLVLAPMFLGGPALAINYTWVGQGADNDWDTCGNWVGAVSPCFPSTTADSAIFASTFGGVDVNLVDESIKDLIITGTVRFGAASSSQPIPSLTTETVTITGQTGGTEVTISVGAKIVTD